MKGLVKMLVDETNQGISAKLRESLQALSKVIPFTFIDDYRLAINKNMLRRIDILKEFI